jgi:ACS family hexuronate transporter-like MFS transporter
MGFAEGPVLPIAQSIMAAESSEHRRGFNMGVLQNFFSALLSNFAAPLVLVAIGQIYGWRSAFYVAAVPGFVVAALIVAFIREPSSGAAPISAASARNTIPLSTMLKHRNIWVCAIVSCLMVSWLLIQITFLPIYLVQVRGLSPSAMSVAVAATGIATVASSIIVPALSDRFGRRPILILSGFVGVIAPVATVMFDGPLPLLVLFMGVGHLAVGSFSLFMATVPSETIPPTHVATALGFIMGVGERGPGPRRDRFRRDRSVQLDVDRRYALHLCRLALPHAGRNCAAGARAQQKNDCEFTGMNSPRRLAATALNGNIRRLK